MTFAGTLEPTEPIGPPVENGGKLWWAVTGSNRRPSRCKRWVQRPSNAANAAFPHLLVLLGSVSVPAGGSNGTARTSRLLAARIEARQGQDRATGLGSREPEMPAQPLFRNPSW
jgi:hypothetical protein